MLLLPCSFERAIAILAWKKSETSGENTDRGMLIVIDTTNTSILEYIASRVRTIRREIRLESQIDARPRVFYMVSTRHTI